MADVLVVDDDSSVRAVMREVLEDEGHTVREAADGRAALAALSASPTPLVVVLDMRLPGMDGIGLLARIQDTEAEAARRYAFILCTAGRMDFAADVQDLLERMQATLLAKPFEIDALLSLVASAAQRLAGR